MFLFRTLLNETLLNLAIPVLVSEMNASPSTVQWVVTGYMLIMGILIPVSSLMIQWFTTRQLFIGSLIVFSFGTFVSGLATVLPYLFVGRFFQAMGTALLLPLMMHTLLMLYPLKKRGSIMGFVGLVIMVAPAIGPPLSGVILEFLNWRWLFFMVLPFIILIMICSIFILDNVTTVTRPRIDINSILLSILGFGGIVFGLSYAGDESVNWLHPSVTIPLCIGMISLSVFVWRQLKSTIPMLEMRTFKYPMFALAAILIFIGMMTQFSTIILLPFLFENAIGISTVAAGLTLLSGALINGAASPFIGRIFDKFGPKILVIPGMILLVIGLQLFTKVNEATSTLLFIVLYTLVMIAIAMIIMPAQTNGLNQLPKKYYSHGTAIFNTL
ncbi:DHA2 family efflux MFS transporter permease subunit [Oceanobacillus jeddahense]|uniref:DHA2 family efflux MFS transporter permease subunit n=1 Tax=Oceanobacillus jeddahense TaxID=1462527 RepID=A0ABY5JZN4_9BACI|nr:DHA2 family efflux MFS transporter permease subunit [Oceanobacillus jeddahense]UUI05564.1 DHA2 family efflux MFS transporter permease subunit [Oceanobacillus jeddahense]